MRTSFRPFKPPSVRKIDSSGIDLNQILLNGQRETLILRNIKILRVVHTQAILFLKSLSERVGSDIERLRIRMK